MKKLGLTVLTAIVALGFVGCGGECTHQNASKVEAKSATCVEEGNYEYWLCHDCLKYFKDEGCTQEYSWEELKTPTTGHTFGDGLYCTGADCSAEKPRTTELAGHTYYVTVTNMDYDREAATEDQNTALGAIFLEEESARRCGSAYTFDEQGGVSAKHISYDPVQGTESEYTFTATYVRTGNSFTMSCVFNAGTPDEEVATETYTLDEYGRWIQTVEIQPNAVAGYEGATLEVMLQERQDHILRCKEGQSTYALGICEYCGGEQPKLADVEGTTWKFASVKYAYEDGVEENSTVDAFVQNYFANFLNTTYIFNAGGTVTASAGSAKDWIQYGNTVELSIHVGVDEAQQPVYWRAVCLVMEETKMQVYYEFTDAELDGAGISDVYKNTSFAVITLTLGA